MKCPHCLQGFHDSWQSLCLGSDVEGPTAVTRTVCPECKRQIIKLVRHSGPNVWGNVTGPIPITAELAVYPKGTARVPMPPEVPPELVADHREACLVLPDSPKASAALRGASSKNSAVVARALQSRPTALFFGAGPARSAPDFPVHLQRRRHRFDRTSRVMAHSVLNGLHHEYSLLARAT
jgi:hypothetical protein